MTAIAPRLTLKSSISLSSGFAMPLLGFGVYQNRGPSCVASCLHALKSGYRHIDAAILYKNEVEVGQAVRESGIPREDIFITSKIFSRRHGYESTLNAVDESLANFGLDYIDLYLVHDPLSGKENRLKTYRALLEAQRLGKIRSVGVSNYGVAHLQEIESEGLAPPSVNQIELHPFCQQPPIVEYCRKNSIVIQAHTPLVRGSLSDKTLLRIARDVEKSPFQICIRWSLQKGFVPLPKSADPEHIEENADVFGFELSKDEMEAVDGLHSDTSVTWNPVKAH